MHKKFIVNKDENIVRVHRPSIILLIFMSDVFFLDMSSEGCFTFIIHHFVWFMSNVHIYATIGKKDYVLFRGTSEYKLLNF